MRKFLIDPIEVCGGAVHDGQHNELRQLIGVERLDGGAQAVQHIMTRLDDQEMFGGRFDFFFPAIDAAGRKDVDAGGEAMFDQVASNGIGLFLRFARGEDDDLLTVGHVTRIAFGPGAQRDRGLYDRDVNVTIELDREDDGRWIAEALELPGVMCYGETRDGAISNAERLAIEVISDRIAHGEL